MLAPPSAGVALALLVAVSALPCAALANDDRRRQQTIVQRPSGDWAAISHDAVDRTESKAVATVRCEKEATKVRLRRYAPDGTWMVEDNYRFEDDETKLWRRISFAQSPTVLREAGEVRGTRFKIERRKAEVDDKPVTPEAWLKKPSVGVFGSVRQLPFRKLVKCERR